MGGEAGGEPAHDPDQRTVGARGRDPAGRGERDSRPHAERRGCQARGPQYRVGADGAAGDADRPPQDQRGPDGGRAPDRGAAAGGDRRAGETAGGGGSGGRGGAGGGGGARGGGP